MKPKGKNKDWKSMDIRLGTDPIQLQSLAKNGQLNPHMNVRIY
jgi:hypothetical protein